MAINPQAGKPVDPSSLVDVDALVGAYYDTTPDPGDPAQRVAFGTSGHRGSAFRGAFNEAHILAITEAICRYRATRGYTGPLFLGRDTHALSEPATRTALGVLVANGVDVRVDAFDGFTPTPALSHAIITANRPKDSWRRLADGIVVTPSHNPPDDGGFKYNPPNGGPADTEVTSWIQDEANRILEASGTDGVDGIKRVSDVDARVRATPYDFMGIYVADLDAVIDMKAIAKSGLRIGVDPMGGASVRVLGRHRRAIRPGPDGHQRQGRPAVRVHDRRLGRQDPDGPVVAACDGQPRRAARRVRYRARQRRRRRPTRRGDADGRLAQPEPLPVRGDRLPVRRGARLGRATWRSARRSCRRR